MLTEVTRTENRRCAFEDVLDVGVGVHYSLLKMCLIQNVLEDGDPEIQAITTTVTELLLQERIGPGGGRLN